MNIRRLVFLFFVLCVPSLRGDDITYYINQTVGSGSVTGNIVTDGTIGDFTECGYCGGYPLDFHIVSYDLTLQNGSTMAELDTSNSYVSFNDNILSATSSQLLFNSQALGLSTLEFNSLEPTDSSSWGQLFLCGIQADCVVPGAISMELDDFSTLESSPLSGNQVIGTEGATLALQGGLPSSPLVPPCPQPPDNCAIGQITGQIASDGAPQDFLLSNVLPGTEVSIQLHPQDARVVPDQYVIRLAPGSVETPAEIQQELTGATDLSVWPDGTIIISGFLSAQDQFVLAGLNNILDIAPEYDFNNTEAPAGIAGQSVQDPESVDDYTITFYPPIDGSVAPAVPEPASFALFAIGSALVAALCLTTRGEQVKSID